MESIAPSFRRGCWLSDYPVEVTSSEEVELIKDFGREEIEWETRRVTAAFEAEKFDVGNEESQII